MGGKLTEWFPITTGVRQGDSLSPTSFAIFVNNLAEDVRNQNAGVQVGDMQIPILLYADDVVLISPNTANPPKQLDPLNVWCDKWCISVNKAKSQILHIRHHQKQIDNRILKCDDKVLDYIPHYKYLGYTMQECLSSMVNVEALTSAAVQSCGGIVCFVQKAKEPRV